MNAERKPLVIRKTKNYNDSASTSHLSVVAPKDDVIEKTREKLEDFLKMLVDHPDEVSLSVSQGERTTIFKIDCSKRNFGKILGSRGKMITSLRNLALAITARHGFRSIIEIPYYAPDVNGSSEESDSSSDI